MCLEPTLLHLQTCCLAIGVLAVAGRLWTLGVRTGGAAMQLAASGLTVTARMFAFLCGGHIRSSYQNMPSIL